jgi:nucleotide-binding universal stress UspA family protein
MIHIHKILVPIDFSEASKMALNYGFSLAREFEARLVLAHVAPFDSAAYEQAKVPLLDLVPAAFREEFDFETVVKAGDVREEILGIVGDKDIDLVIMGTRGRSYFERLILGSVTERMLRKLPIPVVTVSHLDPDESGLAPIRHILYAEDLSGQSQDGLALALHFARGLDAALTVAHVVEPFDSAFVKPDLAPYLPDTSREIRRQAEEKLSRTVALASDGTVPITTIVSDGIPYKRINALASECKADMIVINLQSKGRLERALLGTTAERVVRTATVPVLSLPMPATYKSRWAAA